MSLYELCDWKETKEILKRLMEMCTCLICKKVSENPQEYICGHFFCEKCIDGSINACPMCSVPSHAQDIRPDLLVSSSINVLKVLSQLLLNESDCPESFSDNKLCTNDKDVVEIGVSKRKSTKAKGVAHTVEGNPTKAKRQPKASERKSLPVMVIHEEKPLLDEVSPNSKNKFDFKRPKTRLRNQRKSEPNVKDNVENENKKSSKSLSAIDKRNVKGETKLQIACIKGDVEQVNQLLKDGANPNTKDFAGWTPLHEAVQRSNILITETLLRAGSMVNATGADNVTALHEAVMTGNLNIAKLLVSFGANIHARSAAGFTPSGLASTDEMKAVLQDTLPTEVKEVAESSQTALCPSEYLFFACNLSQNERQMLQKLSYTFQLQVTAKYKPEVTHILTSTDSDQNCTASLPIYRGILSGKWIISFQWVLDSISKEALLDHSSYEVKGTASHPGSEAPKKARINAIKQLPGIFDGCHVYVAVRGNVQQLGQSLNKNDLMSLIRIGGGSILYREPNPESIPDNECTVPFHADAKGSLAKCSHYIIYACGKMEPLLKYKMQHIKTLSIDWLFECIEKFELCSP